MPVKKDDKLFTDFTMEPRTLELGPPDPLMEAAEKISNTLREIDAEWKMTPEYLWAFFRHLGLTPEQVYEANFAACCEWDL